VFVLNLRWRTVADRRRMLPWPVPTAMPV
jgi:hypothetical protein